MNLGKFNIINNICEKSAVIDSVGYCKDTSELYIKYLTGGEYIFQDVPENIYLELIASDSLGRYSNTRIRNIYKFMKLN